MYRLIITELAHEDLDAITSYIAVQLANPMAAARFLDEIERCYGFLQSTPEMYELCRDPSLSAKGYRKTVIGNYILVYQIDKAAKSVIINRFFYGGMNYATLI